MEHFQSFARFNSKKKYKFITNMKYFCLYFAELVQICGPSERIIYRFHSMPKDCLSMNFSFSLYFLLQFLGVGNMRRIRRKQMFESCEMCGIRRRQEVKILFYFSRIAASVCSKVCVAH